MVACDLRRSLDARLSLSRLGGDRQFPRRRTCPKFGEPIDSADQSSDRSYAFDSSVERRPTESFCLSGATMIFAGALRRQRRGLPDDFDHFRLRRCRPCTVFCVVSSSPNGTGYIALTVGGFPKALGSSRRIRRISPQFALGKKAFDNGCVSRLFSRLAASFEGSRSEWSIAADASLRSFEPRSEPLKRSFQFSARDAHGTAILFGSRCTLRLDDPRGCEDRSALS